MESPAVRRCRALRKRHSPPLASDGSRRSKRALFCVLTHLFRPSPSAQHLEGMVGNVGFDPMGLSTPQNIKWMREAELKHGRMCQLAWIVRRRPITISCEARAPFVAACALCSCCPRLEVLARRGGPAPLDRTPTYRRRLTGLRCCRFGHQVPGCEIRCAHIVHRARGDRTEGALLRAAAGRYRRDDRLHAGVALNV